MDLCENLPPTKWGYFGREGEIWSKDDSSKENWSRKIGRAENWSKDYWSSGKLVEGLLVKRKIGRRIIGRAENWSSGKLVERKIGWGIIGEGGKLVEKGNCTLFFFQKFIFLFVG